MVLASTALTRKKSARPAKSWQSSHAAKTALEKMQIPTIRSLYFDCPKTRQMVS
jgi:hypothetical protein